MVGSILDYELAKEEVHIMHILEWVITELLQFTIPTLDNIVHKYLWCRGGWEA